MVRTIRPSPIGVPTAIASGPMHHLERHQQLAANSPMRPTDPAMPLMLMAAAKKGRLLESCDACSTELQGRRCITGRYDRQSVFVCSELVPTIPPKSTRPSYSSHGWAAVLRTYSRSSQLARDCHLTREPIAAYSGVGASHQGCAFASSEQLAGRPPNRMHSRYNEGTAKLPDHKPSPARSAARCAARYGPVEDCV